MPGGSADVPDPRAIADTYDNRSGAAGWELVERFRSVQEAMEHHPDAGPATLADRTGVSEGDLRKWMYSDSVPYPVQTLRTCRDREWILPDADHDRAEPLAGLVGLTTASGSIKHTYYRPRWWTPDEAAADHLRAVAERFGVAVEHDGTDDERKWQPSSDESVLGRVLAAAGAPVGQKTDGDLRVPDWIEDGPEHVRRGYFDAWMAVRGDASGERLRIYHQNADDEFYRSLGELATSVLGGEWTVRPSLVVVPESDDLLASAD